MLIFESANIADIKQRVAASEAKLYTAAHDSQQCATRLLDLLDRVESDLKHKQQQIRRLKRTGRVLALFSVASCLSTVALIANGLGVGIMNELLNGTLLYSQVTSILQP